MTSTLPASETPQSGMSFNDVLFAIFKHKGKIVLGILFALGATAFYYKTCPTAYQSDAKLLVRYVLDRSPVDPLDGQSTQSSVSTGFGRTSENVIGSEAEILRSWDLAREVAQAIGPKRLLAEAGDAATDNRAAAVVNDGVEVLTQPKSDIISVSYKHKDPELSVLVLEELVNGYLKKHLEVHRSSQTFDFVTQQADQARARLSATEVALKDLKVRAGITSVADNSATLNTDLIKLEDQYGAAQAELIEQKARVKQLEESLGATGSTGSKPSKQHTPKPTPAPPPASSEDVQNYQAVVGHLADLRKQRLELLAKYTAGAETVRLNQNEIANTEQQKRELEKKFPDLIGQAPTGGAPTSQLDLQTERTRLAGLQARTDALKARLDEKIKQLSDVGFQIADLERRRDLEETNYKYFQSAVEKARVDEALDPNKVPNISIVQKPCPPRLVSGKRDKIAMMMAGGGIALSIGLAILAEMFLNRTVKGRAELDKLGVPLMLSIPYSRPMKRLQQPRKVRHGESELLIPRTNGANGAASWEVEHFMRPYAEAIRDRLNLYFELNRMTHKPKLVGVTGFAEGAGSSTMAASLAASLSEQGDGKVLLVDGNLGVGRVHPFFQGKPAYPLTTALEPSSGMDSAGNNLYLATVTPPGAGPMQLALKRFFELMPNLKASDFDYIVFDMPPLTDTTPTLGMSRMMDKVLLIVEAEKTGRDMVKRGYAQLTSARANVSVVLNKTCSYVPAALSGES